MITLNILSKLTFKKKYLIIPSAILAIILVWYLYFIYYFKSDLQKKIIKSFPLEYKELSIEFKMLFFPYVKIKNISHSSKNFNFDKINLHFNIFSLFKKKIDLSNIDISEASIVLTEQILSMSNYTTYNTKILDLNEAFESEKLKLQNLNIQNLRIFTKDENSNLKLIYWLKDLNYTKTNPTNSLITANTNFASLELNIEKEENNHSNMKIRFTQNGLSLFLVQNFTENKLISGSSEISFEYSKKDLNLLFPVIAPLVSNTIMDTEKITITCDIDTQSHLTHVKNIKISSKNLTGLGQALFSSDSNDTNHLTLSLRQNRAIISTQTEEQSPLSSKTDTNLDLQSIFSFFLLEKNFDLLLNIDNITSTPYLKLSNISLQYQSRSNSEGFLNFSSNLNDEGGILMRSKILKENTNKICRGEIVIVDQLKNILANLKKENLPEILPENVELFYQVSSPIKIGKYFFSLRNLKMESLNHSVFLDMLNIASNKPVINTNLSYHKFKNTEYKQSNLSILYNSFMSIFKPTQNGYSQFFSRISQLPYQYFQNNHLIIHDNLSNQPYEEIFFNVFLAPKVFKIQNIFSSKENNFFLKDSNLALNILIKPEIFIDLKFQNIHQELIYLDLAKLVELNLNFYKLRLNLSMKNSSYKDITLHDLKMHGTSDSNSLTLKEIFLRTNFGTFIASGEALFLPFSLTCKYDLSKLNLRTLYKYSPLLFPNMNGTLTISGNLSTHGNSVEELIYNLSSQAKASSKNLKAYDLSLDEVAKRLKNSLSQEEIGQYIKTNLLSGTTRIEDMTSDISIMKGIIKSNNLYFLTVHSLGVAKLFLDIYNTYIDFSSNIFLFEKNLYLKNINVDDVIKNYPKEKEILYQIKGHFSNPTKEMHFSSFKAKNE